MSLRFQRLVTPLALAALVLLLAPAASAFAQAHNPFSVGISEGGGSPTGLTGWILSIQGYFEQMLATSIRATRANWRAGWGLIGLSFIYGVFHAAGPGHGKAVMSSYLIANERALRRGLVLALLAALLQGTVAVALVGIIAAILHQTAVQMRTTAQWVEQASYTSVAVLGAWLVWRKGRALAAALRPAAALVPAFAGGSSAGFVCEPCEDDTPGHVHGPDCGHVHMPDPTRLGGRTYSLREAAATVFAAGIRPCSGAILVLVFALSQGIFWVGVVSTYAMALGTAITTGALAGLAVFAKATALRFTGETGRRGVFVARFAEFAAALLVLSLGLLLVMGYIRFF